MMEKEIQKKKKSITSCVFEKRENLNNSKSIIIGDNFINENQPEILIKEDEIDFPNLTNFDLGESPKSRKKSISCLKRSNKSKSLNIDDYSIKEDSQESYNKDEEQDLPALSKLDTSNSNKKNLNFPCCFKKSNNQNHSKILIIDDHKYIRDNLKNLISLICKEKKIYIDILEGNDGIDMLSHLKKNQSSNNKIKCIITDENMEYLNGSEAIRIIRKLEQLKKFAPVEIVSITAYEDEYNKKNITESGSNFILSKPCKKMDIVNIIEKNYMD